MLALIILDIAAFILRIHHKLSADELAIANTIQEKISRSIGIMKTSSQLLLFNVEDILGIAQIRANKFQKNITEFNVGKCLDDIVGIQQFKAEQLGIEVQALIKVQNHELNKATEELHVRTDEKRFQQILVNLLSNALKFTRRGSVRLLASYVPPLCDRVYRLGSDT